MDLRQLMNPNLMALAVAVILAVAVLAGVGWKLGRLGVAIALDGVFHLVGHCGRNAFDLNHVFSPMRPPGQGW